MNTGCIDLNKKSFFVTPDVSNRVWRKDLCKALPKRI